MGPIAGFKVIFGFDDGEIKEFGEPELAEMVGNETLLLLEGDPRSGLHADVRGVNAAAAFTTMKGYPEDKVVGVLLGLTEWKLFGADVYSEHRINLGRLGTERASSRRRSSGDEGAVPTQQERLGMHTFTTGDRVTYIGLEDDETYEAAWVYAIVYKAKSGREQARKFLILFEPSTQQFCLQTFTTWRRIGAPGSVVLDPDHPLFKQSTIDGTQEEEMQKAWDEGDKLGHLRKLTDAVNCCKWPPPSLVVQRKAREKASKAEKLEEKKKARSAAIKAAARAEKDKVRLAAVAASEKRVAATVAAAAASDAAKVREAAEKQKKVEEQLRVAAKERLEKAQARIVTATRQATEAEAAAAKAEAAAAAQKELVQKAQAKATAALRASPSGPDGGLGHDFVNLSTPGGARGPSTARCEDTPESVVQIKRKLARLEGEQREARHRGDVDKAVQRQGEIEELLFDLKRVEKRRRRCEVGL